MRENVVERHLVQVVEKMNGMAIKLATPHQRSLPDRLILLPRSRSLFVEVKAPGKKPTRSQLHMHHKLRMLGHTVVVLDSKECVNDYFDALSR